MIRRLGVLLRVEVVKLSARRLPLLAALAIVAVALVAPQLGRVVDTASALAEGRSAGGDGFANGWTVLTGAVQSARPFLVVVVLVLAASAVAEETGQGTLKAVLARPVRRTEVLLAKALAIWAYGAAVTLAVVAAGAVTGELTKGLYDVVDPQYPDVLKHAFGDMATWTAAATGLTILALGALTALGLGVSVLFDHAGHATGAAVVGFFLLAGLSGVLDADAASLVFTDYVSFAFQKVDGMARQFSGEVSELRAGVLRAAVVPAVWAGALFAAAALVLEARDVTS